MIKRSFPNRPTSHREAAEAKAAEEQTKAASSLPSEPAADCGQTLANIRFRTPSTQLQRRFLGSDTLEILLLYLRSEGFRPEEYKVRNVLTLPQSNTLI